MKIGTLEKRTHWLFISGEWRVYGSTATASARVGWSVHSWQFQLSVWLRFVVIFSCDSSGERIADGNGCNANIYAAC